MRKSLTDVIARPCAALLAVAMLAACGGKKEPKAPGIAKIACDESFESIMEQEVNVYEYIYPKEDVIALYMPENEAVDSIMAMGSVKGAVITRPLTEKEVAYLRSNKKIVHQQKIAVDALARKPGGDSLQERHCRDSGRRRDPLGSGRAMPPRRNRRHFRPSRLIDCQIHA